MFFNSRLLIVIIAISVATVTTIFLSLVEGISHTALWVAFILAFSSTCILNIVALEFLFFREISKIYQVLDEMKKKDLSDTELSTKSTINPFKSLYEKIVSYAAMKQLEIDELRKLETFRREFLADVSHELKTPIFAAQGFVHTLLDGAVDDKNVRLKFLKKAAKNLDGLDALVQDLLTLSHMETGGIRMNYESFNIYELTREVMDQLEGKAERKHITIRFNPSTLKNAIVLADHQRIYQVMLNLISNAIKYTQEGGEVGIGIEADKSHISLHVKDNGPGISPEHVKRIFERFYRVEKSRSKDKDNGGTGLGLAIVKHILEAHRSRINVVSSIGKGAAFSFKLERGD